MQATRVVTTEGMTPWHGFNECGLKFGCAVMAAIFCICHVLSEHGNTTTVLLRAIHPAFSRNIYMTLGDWLPAGLIHSLSLTLNTLSQTGAGYNIAVDPWNYNPKELSQTAEQAMIEKEQQYIIFPLSPIYTALIHLHRFSTIFAPAPHD